MKKGVRLRGFPAFSLWDAIRSGGDSSFFSYAPLWSRAAKIQQQGRIHGYPCRGKLDRGSNKLGRGINDLGWGIIDLGWGSIDLGRSINIHEILITKFFYYCIQKLYFIFFKIKTISTKSNYMTVGKLL